MNKKIFLTSILAIGFAMPAMAENITNASTCNTGVLGQSDNNSTANVEATWTANTYSEPAGQYLLFNNGTITQHTTCPAGSFCVGFTNQAFNDASMGIATCPTGYTNSAAGATAQGQCYATGTATCSTRNPYSGANPTKVTNVTYGNSTNGSASCKTYYGDQTTCVLDTANACDITDITCATGYRKTGGSSLLASVDVSIDGDHRYGKVYYNNGDFCWADDGGNVSNCSTAPFTTMSRNDWQTEFSYGTVKGHASCNTTINPTLAVVMENMDAVQDGDMTPQEFMAEVAEVSSQEDTAKVQDILTRYMSGTIEYEDAYQELIDNFGKADPSAFNSNSGGQYCWCQTESFTPTNGSTVDTSSSWVFNRVAGGCASGCPHYCAGYVQSSRGFRGALFGSVVGGETSFQCVANTINIDWDPKNGENHISGQCTYDSTITLPTEPSKTGYTFGG